MGVEPFLVAASVRGVQAQRLVRRACPRCSDSPLGESLDCWVTVHGCDACDQSGYTGRTGIYELVPVTGELQELIVSGAKLNELKSLALQQGHRTLLGDGLLKASHGRTTAEEVTRLTLEE